MLRGSSEIAVRATEGFTLIRNPERLDRWLNFVKESGGMVVAKPENVLTVNAAQIFGESFMCIVKPSGIVEPLRSDSS